jgi:hypothetical protein
MAEERYPRTMDLIFEVRDAEEGGLWARAVGQPIFTQAETWDELEANLLEVAELHFEDTLVRPQLVHVHYVND